MKKLFKKIFGSRNDRLLSDYSKIVDEINFFEDHLKNLSDQEISAKTEELKSKYEKHNDLDQPKKLTLIRRLLTTAADALTYERRPVSLNNNHNFYLRKAEAR